MPFGRLPPRGARAAAFGGLAGPRPITSPTCFRGAFVALLRAGFFAVPALPVRAAGAVLFAVVVVLFVAGAAFVLLDVVLVATARAPARVVGRTDVLRTAMTSPCSEVEALCGHHLSCKRASSTGST